MKFFPINSDFLQAHKDLEKDYKNLLTQEIGLKLSNKFFIFQDNYYPIKIKFYISQSDAQEITLGNFNSINLTLSINYFYYNYLDTSEKLNLLRHEFAHYLAFILRGEVGTAHDDYYRRLCQSFGWGEEVYGAKIDSSILQKINAQKKNSRKAEKLLALANNNPSWEEAQSALMKAKALMDKSLTSQSSDSEYVALELTYGTRISSKLQTVTWLLESFNCKTIFLTTPGRFTLEVICKNQDMENILDLFNFFNQQIDLWYLESKKYNGKLHRGSFYKGLYQGFKQKLQQNNKVVFEHEKTLIQVDEENLKKHFRMLYPRVGSSYTKVKNDAQSFYQGILQGRRLELKNKLKNDKYFLT